MDFFKHTDNELFDIARPIMESMIEGTNNKDYERFSSYFSSKMYDLVGKEKFIKQTESNIPVYGELETPIMLGCIRRESGATIVYKQNTRKKKGELLGQLLLDEEEGQIKVFYAGIQ